MKSRGSLKRPSIKTKQETEEQFITWKGKIFKSRGNQPDKVGTDLRNKILFKECKGK